MKDRIVIWGTDQREQDILVAIRLLHNEDIIKIWTFSKEGLDKDFAEKLFENWEEGMEDSFPKPHQLIERGITEENLLPENIKTKKSDVIRIAEQEWRVRVLSFRLYEHLKEQIKQLDIRAANLTMFSKDVWEEAKDVSKSIKENTLDRNIKREHTTELRNSLDPVFDKLKKLQENEHDKFLAASKTNLEGMQAKIDGVMTDVENSNNTKKAFDALKVLQQETKGIELITKHHYSLRTSFNKAFEALKEKRKAGFSEKIGKRVEGLKGAIAKMESSIKRDKDSSVYQTSKLSRDKTTQLEHQLRSAKIKLIDDRIESKQAKLNDMYLTLKDLEKKAGQAPKPKTDNSKKPKEAASKVQSETKKAEKKDTKEDNGAKSEKPKVADKAKAAAIGATIVSKSDKEELAEVMADLEVDDVKVEAPTPEKVEAEAKKEVVKEKVETEVKEETSKVETPAPVSEVKKEEVVESEKLEIISDDSEE